MKDADVKSALQKKKAGWKPAVQKKSPGQKPGRSFLQKEVYHPVILLSRP